MMEEGSQPGLPFAPPPSNKSVVTLGTLVGAVAIIGGLAVAMPFVYGAINWPFADKNEVAKVAAAHEKRLTDLETELKIINSKLDSLPAAVADEQERRRKLPKKGK